MNETPASSHGSGHDTLTGHRENDSRQRPGPFSRRWRTRCETCLRIVPAWAVKGDPDWRQVASHQPPSDPNGCCRCEGSLAFVPLTDCLDSAAMARMQAITGQLPAVPAPSEASASSRGHR